MDCKDLTIYDYIKHNGVIKIVDAVYLYSVSVHDPSEEWSISEAKTYPVDDIEPIELTEEILVKNGFKKQEDVNEWSYYKSKDGKGQYMILWSMDYNYLEIGSYTEEFGEFNRMGMMRYVHQLQHALRLCGIEKEIEL